LRHKCWRIFIIHCLSVLYSLFGDGEGQGYTVCMSINICQSNQWNSAARMSQYIAYLGMEKGRVTLSVRGSTSVSQTNGILRHECRRISIIHCMLVTTMCHQWKSAARLLQIFDHRSMSVSHTTRNLRHVCHRIFLNLSVVCHLAGTSMKSAAQQKLISGKHVCQFQ
jgi:hypothetical protein